MCKNLMEQALLTLMISFHYFTYDECLEEHSFLVSLSLSHNPRFAVSLFKKSLYCYFTFPSVGMPTDM